MRSFVVPYLLLGALALLPACGTSAGAEGLQGLWFGPSYEGAISIMFDGRGHITDYSLDGAPTGRSGWAVHQHGSWYYIDFDDGGWASLLVSADGEHAGFVHDADGFAALQRGAVSYDPDGYVLEDITERDYGTELYFIDADAYVTTATLSEASILEDATYIGSDGRGRVFQSPFETSLEVLDAARGVFEGPYEDQFQDTDAFMALLMTPDKNFVFATGWWPPAELRDGWFATWHMTPRPAPVDPPPTDPEAEDP